ncbi:MAG: 3-deoxy-manno-octulosonate-8-phosphatase KdsC [Gammaproteobacteria bacterium]|nr:3-deoxy-manno-octulosonate-8-phosphatase KdsC [Gammaproteobacteria bacterium]
MLETLEKARCIKLAIFDVDGVLTSGGIQIGDDGQEYKTFNSKDGHGMKMLQGIGVKIAIITGRASKVVGHRMTDLGIEYVYQGRRNKLPAFEELLERLAIPAEQTAYVGDDVVDLPVMTRVGLAICVQDAHPLVKRHAHWITASAGGNGAAREVCEMIMDAQGALNRVLDEYLK